jgi:hypothetical protein
VSVVSLKCGFLPYEGRRQVDARARWSDRREPGVWWPVRLTGETE